MEHVNQYGMKIENENRVVQKILDEQFKIIGSNKSFEEIDEILTIGKKKIPWFEYYKFENKEQYEKWKAWAIKELQKVNLENTFDEIDMLWGFCYKWKEGSKTPLTLFD